MPINLPPINARAQLSNPTPSYGTSSILGLTSSSSVGNTGPLPYEASPPVPAVTLSQFRKMLPEFADSSVYLDEIVQPWLNVALQQLNSGRWGSWYTTGVIMFVAHQLAIGRQTTLQASRGGAPGFGIGMLASKAINGVSISYNTTAGILKDGGDYNLTIYGIRFLTFARMVGSGGFQVRGADTYTVSEADMLSGSAGDIYGYL